MPGIDDDFEYLRPVARLLAARDVDGLIALLPDEGPVGRHAMFALAEIGSEALAALQEGLDSEDRVVAGWAAVALADMGDEGADDRLVGLVGDIDCSDFSGPPFEVWEAAIVILGQRKVRAAVEPLLALLSCDDTDIREAVAWSLGEIGDDRAVEPLSKVLLEEDVASIFPECWWISDALQSLGGEKAERALAQWKAREEAWWIETRPS